MTKHEDHAEPPRQPSDDIHHEDMYVQGGEQKEETPSSILVNNILLQVSTFFIISNSFVQ